MNDINNGNPVRPDQNGYFDKVKTAIFELSKGVFKYKSNTIHNDIDADESIPSVKAVYDYLNTPGGGGIYSGDGTVPTGTLASIADGNTFAIGKWPHFPDPWFDNNDNGILIVPETQVSIFYGDGVNSGGTLEFYNSNTYWKYFGTVISPQIDMDNTGLRMRTNSANSIKILPSGGMDINAGDATSFKLIQGTGSPEGVVTANIGSIYLNRSGGVSSTLYIKTSGDGTNTGWTAK